MVNQDYEKLGVGAIVVRNTSPQTLPDDVPAGTVGRIVQMYPTQKIRVYFIDVPRDMTVYHYTQSEVQLATQEEILEWALYVMKN